MLSISDDPYICNFRAKMIVTNQGVAKLENLSFLPAAALCDLTIDIQERREKMVCGKLAMSL